MGLTLKEKFKKEGFSNYDYLSNVADDFAIGFAEWIEKYQGGTPNFKVLKELLELYKKEKEL